MLNRSEILADAVIYKLSGASIGVVVRGLDLVQEEIDETASIISSDAPFIAVIGYELEHLAHHDYATTIEDAVGWRNNPECAGKIVVFIKDDVSKQHSLEDLTHITARDIGNHLLSLASEDEELAQNLPQKRFWKALLNSSLMFPLSMIEEFVGAISQENDHVDAIPNHLWILGLLKDENVLQAPEKRLLTNRSLLDEVDELSNVSRRRISERLAKAESGTRTRLREGYLLLNEYYISGQRETLANLDIETVQALVSAGKKLVEDISSQDSDSNELPENNNVDSQTKPLTGKSLDRAIAELFVDSDENSKEYLHSFVDGIMNFSEDQQDVVEDISLGDREVKLPSLPKGLNVFVKQLCNQTSWGGIVTSDGRDVKETVRDFDLKQFTAYDPEELDPGLNQSVFSLLRSFDEVLNSEGLFTDELESLVSARHNLLNWIDPLIIQPFALFGGLPDAHEALENYLNAYSAILGNLRRYYAELDDDDHDALDYVLAEMLRLDVVHIRTNDDEWKAMLTPLHPLHLWRFREVFRTVQRDAGETTEFERQQLSEVLPDMPHLLHFIVFSPHVSDTDTRLPQSGNLGGLPIYENKTNRYLGTDAVDFVDNLLRYWSDFAPYSINQISILTPIVKTTNRQK